jgi:flagellar protein FlgJ
MKIDANESSSNLSFYQDIQGLNAIKHNPDSAAALDTVANQFEVQFLQQVLREMRKANETITGDESLVSSDSVRFYQEMCDSQLAMVMANQDSTGLQATIVEQMGGAVEPMAGAATKLADPLKSQK